eukprot:TRINITY_DN150_c0_g1_i1.p1 TRINITY_DN150_c0_g1~~TRINITY_DN150_c0_g1_i1.p1  ORF type:complete len:485 (-),score=135.63 TRINITY_DN150_c0_g1_i1:284-1666(-)
MAINISGIVSVKIIEAKKLIECEASNLIVVCTLDKQSVRTKPVPYSENPVWAEEPMIFDVTNQASDLHVAIWSANGEVFLGQVVFPVVMLRSQPEPDVWMRLEKRKWRLTEKVSGDLHMIVKWQDGDKRISLDSFVILKVLGKGGFGKVMQVRKKDTGRIYAMKAIRKEHVLARNEVEHTLAEKDVLSKMNHPFIIRLKFSFQTDTRLYLVLDYMAGGELFFHLQQDDAFTLPRARFYAAEIVSALGYLHEKGIIYRDLKPENVLLDGYGHVCLTDFGLCKAGLGVDEKTNTFCGSLAYMAPEVLDTSLQTGYGRAADWWSLGCLLYEMMAGLPPFYAEKQLEMVKYIRSKKLEFPDYFTPEAKDICSRLLQRNPNDRLQNAAEIRAHPFFREIDWDMLNQRRIEAPFKPVVSGETDLRYFDKEFTDESVMESYVDSILSQSSQQVFENFTFVAPSELDA